jgi:ATP-dependent Clp protease adaptor protein ClpS
MTKELQKQKVKKEHAVSSVEEKQLILINDEVHSFDYVIDALIEVCDHTVEQATQCTFITHYKGKCDVKRGPLDVLRPMRRALIDKELRATIN